MGKNKQVDSQEEYEKRKLEMLREEIKELCQLMDESIIKQGVSCMSLHDIVIKQNVLAHAIEKGYVCIQNDICGNKYYGISYELTFVKRDNLKAFNLEVGK